MLNWFAAGVCMVAGGIHLYLAIDPKYKGTRILSIFWVILMGALAWANVMNALS